jgi:hypothetical protein
MVNGKWKAALIHAFTGRRSSCRNLRVQPMAAACDYNVRAEVTRLLKDEGMSNRAIADAVGVDEGTVRNDLRAEDSAPPADGTTSEAPLELARAEDSAPTPTDAERVTHMGDKRHRGVLSVRTGRGDS